MHFNSYEGIHLSIKNYLKVREILKIINLHKYLIQNNEKLCRLFHTPIHISINYHKYSISIKIGIQWHSYSREHEK